MSSLSRNNCKGLLNNDYAITYLYLGINLDTLDGNMNNDRQPRGALFGLVLTPCKFSREEISHLS